MKKLVPLFSEYNSKSESFYFDKKMNEAVIPLITDTIENKESIPEKFKVIGPIRTIEDSKIIKDWCNKTFNTSNIKEDTYYTASEKPNWIPDSIGYSFIASLEGLLLNDKTQGAGHKSTGFGINLDVHPNYDIVTTEKEAFDQLEKFILSELKLQFNNWVNRYQYVFNQNMVNALYSFAYSTGPGRLNSLTKGTSEPKGPRNEQILPGGMRLYTNSSNENFRKGLKQRRNAEVYMYVGMIKSKEDFKKFVPDKTWYEFDNRNSNNTPKVTTSPTLSPTAPNLTGNNLQEPINRGTVSAGE